MERDSTLPTNGARTRAVLGYYASTAAFLASAALFLFTLVEMRRGFLFPLSDYLKVGSPSAVLYFDPRHLAPLLLGSLGAFLSHRNMVRLERAMKGRGVNLKPLLSLLTVAIMVVLVADLFIYRGVPAGRIVGAGKMSVGQAIPQAQGWLQPFREGANYLALVWHATLVGTLIGALFLATGARFVKRAIGGMGFRSHLAGSALALSQPFCSCCAAPVGATLYRTGASLGPTMAFIVSSPMLNITGLILAASLLPARFALLRIAGGAVVGILVTYVAAVAVLRWGPASGQGTQPGRLAALSMGVVSAYSRLFRLESLLASGDVSSPATLVSTWVSSAWRLARVVVPVLLVGSVATAAVVAALPSPADSPTGVVTAAALGTLLMVPTWTEIPVAAGLIREGITGPAAALLLTLPAVSLPCLAILVGATGNGRAALLLGLLVFAVGVLAGLVFLAL